MKLVRVAAVASLALLAGLLVYIFVHRAEIAALLWSQILLVVLTLVPYARVLYQLSMREEKRGLALAMGWGGWVFVFSLLPLLDVTPSVLGNGPNWGGLIFWPALLILQALLVAGAAKAYFSMMSESGDVRTITMGILKATGYLAITLIASSATMPLHNPRGNEASAIRSIRAIHQCAAQYAARHPEKGFPASLEVMGSRPDKCLNQNLAAGSWKFYTFVYHAGPADSSGRLRTYTVQAQAINFEQGVRKFFSDQSGTIRWTAESREATAQDPPLT